MTATKLLSSLVLTFFACSFSCTSYAQDIKPSDWNRIDTIRAEVPDSLWWIPDDSGQVLFSIQQETLPRTDSCGRLAPYSLLFTNVTNDTVRLELQWEYGARLYN